MTGACFLQSLYAQGNPFLRPGSESSKPPPVIRSSPNPPPPKPMNSNLELRGFFKLGGNWHFAIFDKVKNQGVWLKKGESFDEGKVQIESFNPDTEVVKMKGGMTLSLKKSQHKILPVPSAQPVKKTDTVLKKNSPIRLPSGAKLPRVQIPARRPGGVGNP
tara:strand:+ start:2151 stop:2633 length:483 start_codon:yes stop_codon:yes gene_type:complete